MKRIFDMDLIEARHIGDRPEHVAENKLRAARDILVHRLLDEKDHHRYHRIGARLWDIEADGVCFD